MKMRELMEAISRLEALKIFSDAGVDASGLDPAALKKAHRALAMKMHPDRGGDLDKMKMINAAYDALSSSKPDASERPRERPPTPKDYTFIDYFQQNIERLAREADPKNCRKWTIWNFDGVFFRGCVSMIACPAVFPEMAKAMNIWDRFYTRKAFFVNNESMDQKLLLIWLDGKVLSPPIEFEHDSFNRNPGNDHRFCDKLTGMLDNIEMHGFKQDDLFS